jgi:hypothetical protein
MKIINSKTNQVIIDNYFGNIYSFANSHMLKGAILENELNTWITANNKKVEKGKTKVIEKVIEKNGFIEGHSKFSFIWKKEEIIIDNTEIENNKLTVYYTLAGAIEILAIIDNEQTQIYQNKIVDSFYHETDKKMTFKIIEQHEPSMISRPSQTKHTKFRKKLSRRLYKKK